MNGLDGVGRCASGVRLVCDRRRDVMTELEA